MNMEKIKNMTARIILLLIVFNLLLANTTIFNGTVYAVQNDLVSFNADTYSDEAEYLQYCLNKLGYKDSTGNVLDTDGYFGNKSKSALNKYLKDNGFTYFSSEAKSLLVSRAENSETGKYESGFTKGDSKLIPTAFVYSNLSNINGHDDPFYSMSVLKELPFIITMKPTELSYKSMRVAESIKGKTRLFGYVNLGPDNPEDDRSKWRRANLNKVMAEIDSIAEAGWHGIFIDQFGYDWGETRERQNTIVDYAHSRGLKCMVNAWFPEDALDAAPNYNANPDGIPAHLNSGDWCLIESFLTDGDSYRGNADYIEKYLKAKQYSESTGVNISVLSYKRDSTSWERASDDIKMSYILASCLGFDGWWFGKTENSDNLLYGREPDMDLGGRFIKPFARVSGNIYTAETEKYRIEYHADDTPVLKLIPKN